jgi:hypothetical protein
LPAFFSLSFLFYIGKLTVPGVRTPVMSCEPEAPLLAVTNENIYTPLSSVLWGSKMIPTHDQWV